MWSNLATDFDQDDETANFGTRLAVEGRGNIYDVVTFAIFEPTSQVSRNPSLVSRCSSSQATALALDSCLHVVETVECDRSYSVLFAAHIDALAWSPCRRFVLAGLSSGQIQLLHAPSRIPLPAMSVGQEGEGRQRSFVACEFRAEKEMFSMRFVATNGYEYSVSPVDLEGLHRAVEGNDLHLMKSIQSKMQFSSRLFSDESIMASVSCGSNFDVVATSGCVGLLNENGTKVNELLPFDYLPQTGSPLILKTTKVMKNILLCLDDTGAIHVICLLTMLVIDVWAEEEVVDLVIMEDEGDSKFKILMTVRTEDINELSLQMREYPSFDLHYALKVSQFCRPLDCNLNQETPMFIEGSYGEGDDYVKSLRMRGICESVLEARLQRLLRRQKFEEAENFARKFNFSLDQVFKAKSTWLLEQLSPWREAKVSDSEMLSNLDELKSTLMKIGDLDFIVHCCVTAALPGVDQIRSLLLLSREIIRNNIEKALSVDLMVVVSKTLQRLETFSLAFPGSSVDDWISFSRRPASEECKILVRNAQMDSALLVWIRHKPEISRDLDTDFIEEILESIPTELTIEKKLKWLGNFLPDCLQVVPDSLPIISAWANQVTRAFELIGRREWPHNGLQFAEGVLKSLCFSSIEETGFSKAQLVLNQQRTDASSDLSIFIQLIDTLRDLVILHSTFRLKIKLVDFLNSDKYEVISLILDWCTESEEITNLVQNFLSNYMSRWDLSMSDVFAQYLQELISHSEFNWHWHFGDAPWEKKAAAIIQFISSVEERASVILDIVKAAPVPWSATVQQLCQDGIKLNHPAAKLIQEQERMVEFKRILRKYEFRDISASGRKLERLIQFMIKENGEEGYRDALEIARVSPNGQEFDAHLCFLKHLLWVKGESLEAVRIFQLLLGEEEKEGVELGERLLIHAELYFKGHKSGLNEDVVAFLSAMKLLLIRLDYHNENLLDRIEDLKRKVRLFNEFGITEISDENQHEIIRSFIQKNMAPDKLAEVYHLLLRLAKLTRCSREFVTGELMAYLTRKGHISHAVEISKCIVESVRSSPESVDSHQQLILDVDSSLTDANDVGELPVVLNAISAHSTTFCNPDKLAGCAALSRWQYFLHRIHDHFHYQMSFSLIESNVDPLNNWTIGQAAYKDKGLPLNKSILGPFVHCLKLLFIQKSEMDEETLLNLYQNGCSIVETLHQSAHTELSLSLNALLADTLAIIALRLSPEIASNISQLLGQKNRSVQDLMPKIMGEDLTDYDLGLAYLMRESKKNALNILTITHSNVGLEYNRLIALSTLGVRYCVALQLVPPLESFKSMLVRSAWGKKTSELSVSFKEAYSGGPVEIMESLRALLKRPEIYVNDIERYCLAFEIDVTSSMLMYIRTSMSELEPIVGEKKKVLKPNNLDLTLSKVRSAFLCVENKKLLKNLLVDLFEEVSPYNYEVLRFLIDQLEHLTNDGGVNSDRKQIDLINRASEVLGFFLNYERLSDPSDKERDTWLETRTGNLPKIAKYRLPISWLVMKLSAKDRYKVLKKEINLNNYYLWCRVAQALKLNPDNICVHAVQNAVDDLLIRPDDEQEWTCSFVNKSLVTQVQACIGFMSDAQKAVSCGHWFATHLPGGVDKLMAVSGCRDTALAWYEKSQSEEAEQALALADLNLVTLSTKNVLHKYELSDEKFSLKKGAEELICELYADPSVVERSRLAGGRFPNIAQAAEKIARVNSVSITKIRFELLDRWLPEKSVTSKSGDKEDSANFVRCTYVAQNGGKELFNYLLQIGFAHDPMIQAGHKLRALKCLLAVADDESILSFSGRSAQEVKTHLQLLHFVTRLAGLNLPYSAETFHSVEKNALVESVLRGCGHTEEGISLLVDLCLHFEIFDTKLWVSLLTQMSRLAMMSQLQATLLELNHHSHLWHFPAFLDAWNLLLQRPFALASIPTSKEQVKACEQAVELLNSCPLAGDLDVKLLWGECRRLKLSHLEAILKTRL